MYLFLLLSFLKSTSAATIFSFYLLHLHNAVFIFIEIAFKLCIKHIFLIYFDATLMANVTAIRYLCIIIMLMYNTTNKRNMIKDNRTTQQAFYIYINANFSLFAYVITFKYPKNKVTYVNWIIVNWWYILRAYVVVTSLS